MIAAQTAAEAVVAPAPEPEADVVVPAIEETPTPIPVLPGPKPRLVSVVSPPAVPADPSPVQEEPSDPIQALTAKVADLEARLAGKPSGAPAAPAIETTTETDEVPADLTPEQVVQLRDKYRAEDETCRAWQQEWFNNNARIEALVTVDPVTGAPIKGVLVDNARKIQTLKGLLNPQELGLSLPELDEVEKDERRKELKELERDNKDALREHRELLSRNTTLTNAYGARVKDHVDQARAVTAQAAAATRESRAEETRQTTAKSEWAIALKEQTAGMTADDRDFVHRELLKEAHAYAVLHDGQGPDDFKAFMGPHMVELKARVIARQSRPRGQQVQERLTRQVQPAPRDAASAAPAPTPAQVSGDPRQNLRAALQRAEGLTRKVAVR